MAGRPYHHGDLPAALVRTSFELLAEHGLAEFSVAKVARRLGISTAAPYRHYSDRDHLLAAVATAAARELTEEIRNAALAAGDDPVERFASAGAAYVRYAVRRGVGVDVIYAESLGKLNDLELAEAGRELMDVLFGLAEAVGQRNSLQIADNLIASAHGYAALYNSGFFTRGNRYSLEEIAERAARAGRALAGGQLL
jgi:AcrR family transcriptional regulator